MCALRHHGLLFPARLRRGRKASPRLAFTLVEMMAATAVLLLIMSIIAGVMNQASTSVRAASSKVDIFQSARLAFDVMTNHLSKATLNTYWDYDDPSNPAKYVRKSDLHFLVTRPNSSFALHFASPNGYSQNSIYANTSGLLNAIGYYVEYGNDSAFRPTFSNDRLPDRYRYRLMQGLQTTEEFALFSDPAGNWITAVDDIALPIANNVIALVVWPRLSIREDSVGSTITDKYTYDSRAGAPIQRAQLPPVVQVTMVVISESSAARLNSGAMPPALIEDALQDKFEDVTKYDDDIAQLEKDLAGADIQYEILTSSVAMRESKWSSTP